MPKYQKGKGNSPTLGGTLVNKESSEYRGLPKSTTTYRVSPSNPCSKSNLAIIPFLRVSPIFNDPNRVNSLNSYLPMDSAINPRFKWDNIPISDISSLSATKY